MSRIVVAKKVRLGMNGDKFDKDLIAQVERTRILIDDDQLKSENKQYKTSGRLYILDKEATTKRDELKKTKKK